VISLLVDSVRGLILVAAQLLGGSVGAGVVAVSLAIRVVLFPVTLRLARRALDQRRRFTALTPELKRLQERLARKPDELASQSLELYRKSGYKPVDPVGLLGGLAQMPFFAGLYGALRQGLGVAASFLWITDLAKPDVVLALAVSAGTGVAAYLGAAPLAESSRSVWFAAGAGAVITLFFCWHASAVLALSWGTSTVVNGVQGLVLLREQRRGKP
jgi:YidC/Oxa1 family membrane protein insertase